MTRIGLVVGKFVPPHLGHHALIDHAGTLCDKLYVVVCDNPVERPDAFTRSTWLAQLHPDAEIVVAPDVCAHRALSPCVPSCSTVWADAVTHLLPCHIDVVVSSEHYGETFAAALGAQHVMFDQDRAGIKVSGTAVRTSLEQHWQHVDPIVRSGLVRRVVVLGSESSGTTTLVRSLSAHLGCDMTIEVGRVMSWLKAGRNGGVDEGMWNEKDFWGILAKQREVEHAAAARIGFRDTGKLGSWLVCDTDTVATLAWWERYLGPVPDAAVAYASTFPPAGYIITDPAGVAFEHDGVRDGEQVRETMHDRFIGLVSATTRPWCVVSGSRTQRTEAAAAFIADLDTETPALYAGGS